MKAPRALARFNLRVTNPIQGTWAWLIPPWAVIVHRGRRSGRSYRTPVIAFRRGDRLAIALFYGDDAQWVRNLRASGGGVVIRAGRSWQLLEPRVVDATADEVRGIARIAGRAFEGVLLARVGEAVPGSSFGPG
jgi:deazaflavin-dependent oxidoreductase (nitroreductase family)